MKTNYYKIHMCYPTKNDIKLITQVCPFYSKIGIGITAYIPANNKEDIHNLEQQYKGIRIDKEKISICPTKSLDLWKTDINELQLIVAKLNTENREIHKRIKNILQHFNWTDIGIFFSDGRRDEYAECYDEEDGLCTEDDEDAILENISAYYEPSWDTEYENEISLYVYCDEERFGIHQRYCNLCRLNKDGTETFFLRNIEYLEFHIRKENKEKAS